VWGCLAKVGLPDFKIEKIGSRSIFALFIGYAYQSAAYQFVTKAANDSYMHGNIIEARHAEFFENIFPMKIASHDHRIPHEASSKRHACSFGVELKSSKRMRKETNFGPDFITDF